ncbi:glutamine amidotransferase-related protein [Streptomyces swartbergensis]|uniref:glutamine amidotransferase-related protein n=1 Tax=Streptomyces swartbergensis TaxID=487165 RepID=UPI0037FAFDCA
MTATRCHWLILAEPLPVPRPATAHAVDDGHVMAGRHRDLDVAGVRFHPESDTTAGALAPPADSRTSARNVSLACP